MAQASDAVVLQNFAAERRHLLNRFQSLPSLLFDSCWGRRYSRDLKSKEEIAFNKLIIHHYELWTRFRFFADFGTFWPLNVAKKCNLTSDRLSQLRSNWRYIKKFICVFNTFTKPFQALVSNECVLIMNLALVYLRMKFLSQLSLFIRRISVIIRSENLGLARRKLDNFAEKVGNGWPVGNPYGFIAIFGNCVVNCRIGVGLGTIDAAAAERNVIMTTKILQKIIDTILRGQIMSSKVENAITQTAENFLRICIEKNMF